MGGGGEATDGADNNFPAAFRTCLMVADPAAGPAGLAWTGWAAKIFGTSASTRVATLVTH